VRKLDGAALTWRCARSSPSTSWRCPRGAQVIYSKDLALFSSGPTVLPRGGRVLEAAPARAPLTLALLRAVGPERPRHHLRAARRVRTRALANISHMRSVRCEPRGPAPLPVEERARRRGPGRPDVIDLARTLEVDGPYGARAAPAGLLCLRADDRASQQIAEALPARAPGRSSRRSRTLYGRGTSRARFRRALPPDGRPTPGFITVARRVVPGRERRTRRAAQPHQPDEETADDHGDGARIWKSPHSVCWSSIAAVVALAVSCSARPAHASAAAETRDSWAVQRRGSAPRISI